jgi:hypothetical protein
VYCTPDESLKTDQITNCITEIPQDIKLELADGELTLKAGSKVYVPNGSGKFDELSVTVDRTATGAGTANQTRMYSYNGSYIEKFSIDQCYSGATAPSGQTYMFWYDTTNNLVKRTTDGGSTWTSGWSLPFAICTSTNNAISSIDQVFNGFGYVGSTVFVLPGVKGLAPNGRNKDSTLKNRTITTTKVIAYTRTVNGGKFIGCITGGATVDTGAVNYIESETQPTANYTVWYKPSENRMFYVVNGVATSSVRFVAWKETRNNSAPYNITAFEPKTTFHAVDYSDFEELDNSAVRKTGDETIGGIKTFTGSYLQMKNNAGGAGVKLIDSGGKGSSELIHYYVSSEQRYYTRLVCRNTAANKYAYVELTMTDGGEVRFGNANLTYMNAPTPSASSNSTDVATTAWANAKFLPLAGGTMSGNLDLTGYQITAGRIELKPSTAANNGGFIDFHYAGSTADYTSRIIEDASGQISVTATKGLRINGSFAPSMPSEKYTTLSLGATGNTYTAPADGYFALRKAATGAQYCTISNDTTGMSVTHLLTSGSSDSIYLPVKSGDVVKISYSLGGTTTWLRFYYAVGAKQLAA